jgi:opine dehydrogenase
MVSMKIAILGAGNGGKAAAADLCLAGHEVRLFELPEFKENLELIKKEGGIHLSSCGRNGFAKLENITTDISEALDEVDIVMPVVTAFGNVPLAEACAPYLKKHHTVILNPGSTLGSLEFLKEIKNMGAKATPKIGELHTMAYACRGTGAQVNILLNVKKLWLSAFPAIDTPEVFEKIKELYPAVETTKNILCVGLNNGNPLAHPSPALLNAGRIEYSKGDFYHYNEGITPHVANVIESIDKERMKLCEVMGYPVIPTPQRLFLMGYGMNKSSVYKAYHTSPIFCGDNPIKGPHSLKDRYFVEDTLYGLVTWSSLGSNINVETPTINAVIQLMSALHKRSYFVEGPRTLEKFGLKNMTVQQLNNYFETGHID